LRMKRRIREDIHDLANKRAKEEEEKRVEAEKRLQDVKERLKTAKGEEKKKLEEELRQRQEELDMAKQKAEEEEKKRLDAELLLQKTKWELAGADKVSEVMAKIQNQVTHLGLGEEFLDIMDHKLDDQKQGIMKLVSSVAKKLPIPTRIDEDSGSNDSFANRAKNVFYRETTLVFSQRVQGSDETHDFEITTKGLRLWVKAAKCVGTIAADVSSGEYVKAALDAKKFLDDCRSSESDGFKSAMKEPHLLSSESDEIITLLREQGFYERHEYNEQTCEWEYDPTRRPTRDGGCCIIC